MNCKSYCKVYNVKFIVKLRLSSVQFTDTRGSKATP